MTEDKGARTPGRGRWLGWSLVGGVVVLIGAVVVASTRPVYADLEANELDVSSISDNYPSPDLGMAMNGYVAVTDDGTMTVDRETGEVAASWNPPKDDYLTPSPSVINIDDEGNAVLVDDVHNGEILQFTRLEGERTEPLEIPEEVAGDDGSFGETSVVATTDGVVTIHACAGKTSILAGLSTADFSMEWRIATRTSYCASYGPDDELQPGRYLFFELGDSSGVFVDTVTGERVKAPANRRQSSSGAYIHEDSVALILPNGSVAGFDVSTGEPFWTATGCPEGTMGSWVSNVGLFTAGDQGSPIAMLRCTSYEAPGGDPQTRVYDIRDGRVADVGEVSQSDQTYLDELGSPSWETPPLNDFDREVGQLLIDDVLVTRVGKRISGTDVFTGEELWVKNLDLADDGVVEVDSSGAVVGARIVVTLQSTDPGWWFTGLGKDEREERVELWQPRTGDVVGRTRFRDVQVSTGIGADILIDDSERKKSYLVEPAE